MRVHTSRRKAVRETGAVVEVAGVDEEQVDVFFLHDNNADLSILCSGRWREKWETYKRDLLHVCDEGGEVAEVATT